MVVQTPTIVAGYKSNAIYVMDRIRKITGAFVQQSDITAINWYVTDVATPTVQVATGTLVVALCIFNILQTNALDPRWPVAAPATGYNVGCQIPGSAFPKGATRYALRIDLTPSVGDILTIYLENFTQTNYPTT